MLLRLSLSYKKKNEKKNPYFVDAVYEVALRSVRPMSATTRNAYLCFVIPVLENIYTFSLCRLCTVSIAPLDLSISCDIANVLRPLSALSALEIATVSF